MADISSASVVVSVSAPPVKTGDFLSSIGAFFGDVGKGIGVASNDVVHAAGAVGSFIVGGVVPFLAATDVPALKAYFMAGGALNLPGIIAVVVGSTLTGLVTLAAKSPDNVIATASTLLTPADIAMIASYAAAKVQPVTVTPAVKS